MADDGPSAMVWGVVFLMAGPFILLALVSGLLGMTNTMAWCLLASWTVLTFVRNPLWASAILMVILTAMVARWHPVPAIELGRTMDRMKIEVAAEGAEALSTRERVGVFALNVVMGGVGHLVGLHEVAWLTWDLMRSGPPERHRDGTFLLNDPAVRSMVAGWKGGAAQRRDQIAWSSYFGRHVSPSVALAANCPLVVVGTVGAEDVSVEASCAVAYPRNASLELGFVEGQRVHIFEGAFWVLQEAGWLSPYTVRWRLHTRWDDPRLQGSAPVLNSREAVLADLLR